MGIPCPIRTGAVEHGAREALVFGTLRWTWKELDAEVRRWERVLEARGVRSGDRVGLLSQSRPETLFLLWAAARLRASVATLNARLTRAELGPLVERTRAQLLVAEARLLANLGEGACSLETLAAEADAVASAGAPREEQLLDPGAPWLILFTSGTTGRPKAAVLCLTQLQASARASAACINGPTPPRWLGTLPLFHVGGLAMVVRCAFDGGTLLLHDRFDADAVNAALDRDGVTHMSLVPTTLERVLDGRGTRPGVHGLQAILIGGGPVPPALLERARALGLPCLQTYGLTEASSQVTTERPATADGSTAGEPLPGVQLRVVDAEGTPLPPGAEGEVEVRGPTVMAGYLDDPEATASAFRDAWFRTHDLGVLDGRGRLRILSRRSDLIVRGGENVYPAEVEAVLLQHPEVAEAAVLPEAHPSWGQVPVAVIVRRGTVAEESLLAFARERLAGFKVPSRCVWVDTLPRNAMNKVDRAALRQVAGIAPR
ncbi:MAG: o-succinylbenzoate--CoA ligase [Myxococcaceae bacterium]|nr:o-succinylbenzoate--CoA ligase [Myxococcaceae bacterium]MCI0670736.1 o-succinylbenzoate--CoA ligase [Myxococcaceae bacterium]